MSGTTWHTTEFKNKVVEDYLINKISSKEISKKYSISINSVQRWVQAVIGKRSQGGQKQYSLNETVFDEINEESAYWSGFLMADGNVKQDLTTLRLKLQSQDYSHIINFKQFLQSTHPIYIDTKGCYSQEVRSKYLINRLKQFNIVPNKTLTAAAPECFVKNRHFWRGAIDGDGCISIEKNNRGNAIIFVGTYTMCQQFIDFVSTLVLNKVTVRKCNGKNLYRVTFKGTRYRVLLDLLYNNSSIFLTRKFLLAQQILKRGQ